MGYTHYFEKLEPDENLARITRKIVELGNVAICGGLGEGEPIITKAKIWLNGSAEKGEDFETFLIEKINDKDVSFNFCKTGMRPYWLRLFCALLYIYTAKEAKLFLPMVIMVIGLFQVELTYLKGHMKRYFIKKWTMKNLHSC